jgi:1-aminocyclopropane-1-carboxylate deaminase
MDIKIKSIRIDEVNEDFILDKNISLKILRLDLLHPTISGNKYFKILPYLQKYQNGNYKEIVTFGGAYSNYLHALAYVCFKNKIPCTAYIRGEKVENHTLLDCKKWGMKLKFIPRQYFDRLIKRKINLETTKETLVIPFGGKINKDIEGIKQLVKLNKLKLYDFIFCSVGTGTTVLGLKKNLLKNKNITGFMATKDDELEQKLKAKNIEINNEYTLGGFAKTNALQIEFIKDFYTKHHIMLDIVYTSKMMMGIYDLIKNGIIPAQSKCLAIHTGGLQGNRSCKELQELCK